MIGRSRSFPAGMRLSGHAGFPFSLPPNLPSVKTFVAAVRRSPIYHGAVFAALALSVWGWWHSRPPESSRPIGNGCIPAGNQAIRLVVPRSKLGNGMNQSHHGIAAAPRHEGVIRPQSQPKGSHRPPRQWPSPSPTGDSGPGPRAGPLSTSVKPAASASVPSRDPTPAAGSESGSPASSVPDGNQSHDLPQRAPLPLAFQISFIGPPEPGSVEVPSPTLSPSQLAALEDIKADFSASVGEAPADPSDRGYLKRWLAALPVSDQRLRARIGWQAFAQLQLAAAQRQARPPGSSP